MTTKIYVHHKHNLTKASVLLLLYDRAKRSERGLSLAEVSSLVPFSYDSLKASLPKWARWRLLNKAVGTTKKGRLIYLYSLGEEGRTWIENVLDEESFKKVEDLLNKTNS